MKRMKYILITLILIILMLMIPIISNADININPSDFKPGEVTNATQFVQKANIVIGVIQAVGSIVAVVTLIIIGIKYMLAGVDEKAEYKSTMIPYVIGCSMLFVISNLLAFIYNIVQKNFN